MKIIRDNVCYVEIDDILFLGILPRGFFDQLKIYDSKIRFQKFSKKLQIRFFKYKKDILNYDDIHNQSHIELEYRIKEIKEQLNKQALKWLNSSEEGRKKLDKDKEYNALINSLKYMLKTLENYKNNKDGYDKEVFNLLNPKRKRL